MDWGRWQNATWPFGKRQAPEAGLPKDLPFSTGRSHGQLRKESLYLEALSASGKKARAKMTDLSITKRSFMHMVHSLNGHNTGRVRPG